MSQASPHPVDSFDYSSLVSNALGGGDPQSNGGNNRFQAEAVTTKMEREDPSGVTHSVVSESVMASSVHVKDTYEVIRLWTN